MHSSLQVCASLGQDTESLSVELGLSRHRDFTICNEICFEVCVQYSKIKQACSSCHLRCSRTVYRGGLTRVLCTVSGHCRLGPSGASFAVLSYWVYRAYCESIAIIQEAAKIYLLRISCSVLWLCKHWTLRHAVSLCQEAAKLVFRGSPALDIFNCMHVQVPKYFGEFEFILTHFLNKLCFGAVLEAISLFTPV